MSNLSKAAQVMLDADAGMPIEQRRQDKQGGWQDSPTPSWNWDKYIYRVKTERLYFVIEDSMTAYRVFDTREAAERVMANDFSGYPGIKVTELVVKPVN